MDIVLCTDTNYVMPCGILFHSICKNELLAKITFHVIIDESVTEKDKNSLNRIISQSSNKSIVFYNIDGHLFDDFPNLGSGNYITKATYYRLYLTKILPPSLHKVLYLDCDMIVLDSLVPLWDIDISDKAVGAVLDGMSGIIQLYNRLQYSPSSLYFNAGVLLINLDYWRQNYILEQCLDFIRNHFDRIVSHDQDVLNYVLRDKKKIIPIKYNYQECYLYKVKFVTYDYWGLKDMIEEARKNPTIVHYTISKPWNKDCMNPMKNLFYEYQNETEWKGTPLQKRKNKLGIKDTIMEYLYKVRLLKRQNPFEIM